MRRVWVALVALLFVPTLAASEGALAPSDTPWWAQTSMDLDRNGVDDALEATLAVASGELIVLVALDHLPTPRDVTRFAAAGHVVTSAYHHFPLLAVRTQPAQVHILLDLEGVLFVEKNDQIQRMLKDSVPLIGAPRAWRDYGATGNGINIAIIDDGAYEQHPDLEPKLVASFDAARPRAPFETGDGNDIIIPAGEKGHGTHVAGTVMGRGGQSGGTYRGVAPDARFIDVKVFDGPDSTSSELVLRGLDWVLDNMNRLNIRVATMSLGGRASDGNDALSRNVDRAITQGLIIVAAAGNTGPAAQTITSPGAARLAITVGAVDKQKAIAGFSSRGPTLDGRMKPDLTAPGVNIKAPVPPTGAATGGGFVSGSPDDLYYGALSGTSMATPHVAGVVALMLSVNAELSPTTVKAMLLATAQDLGPPGQDADTGYGFVNAMAAVQVAQDPSILDSPAFQAILDTLPEPETSFSDKIRTEALAVWRDPNTPRYAVYGVASVVLLIVGIAVGRRLP